MNTKKQRQKFWQSLSKNQPKKYFSDQGQPWHPDRKWDGCRIWDESLDGPWDPDWEFDEDGNLIT